VFRIAVEWLEQRDRTTAFPDAPGRIEGRFRGRPEVDATKCEDGCRLCADACPTDAIEIGEDGARIDLGKCVFCPICVEECPEGAITYTGEVALATTTREALRTRGKEIELAKALDAKMRSLFGRSLRLRQVSAGGCSGCEAELVATGNVVFDLSRFGIGFVASPRHADGIVVTGPVTDNMHAALLETYAAVPPPRLVIAVGACAISGGIFAESPQTGTGVCGLLPVDLYIPGCPPHPLTVLDGLLRLLGRMPGAAPAAPEAKP
jgi:Ni,Fe-hydrogenase III small subunit/Pyruvate/2-oxoacid:ferredoxin oxidoreductase delta subunit